MKKSIFNTANNYKDRTSNILNHISWSLLYKVGSIISNFLIVTCAVSYLGNEEYGIWIVLSSIMTWFIVFDMGIGNGLRNNLAKAIAQDNHPKAQELISTAYLVITLISAFLVLVLVALSSYVDWASVFNTSKDKSETLSYLILITIMFFGFQLITKLIVSIHLANQNHSIQTKVEFCSQAGSLIGILLLFQFPERSLILFGSMYLFSPFLVLLLLTSISFQGKLKRYRPRLFLAKIKYLKEIAGLGLYFFFIQIGAAVIFTSDNIIITQLFGPAEVVPYSITFKYFSIITTFYGVLMTPLWSSFTNAYAKKDIEWIRTTILTVYRYWFLVLVALIIMVLISDWFFTLWIGESVQFDKMLTISMAASSTVLTFGMVFTFFINGIGKLHIQFLMALFVMVFNIPLSIFLALYCGLGLSGVIIGTVLCQTIGIIPQIVQCKKILNGTANGIWFR